MLLIVKLNVSLTALLAESVAVTVMSIKPVSSLVGVPLRTPVVELILNQVGSTEPSASVAVYVKVSLSPSTSAKLLEVSNE